jgi:hypothetical protein
LVYHNAKLGGKPLRDLLMPIFSTQCGSTLFHSVDKRSSGLGTTISFLPHMEGEARAMIAVIIPYLTFRAESNEHRACIRKFFTGEACERAVTCTWYIARNCVVSELYLAVDELDDPYRDSDHIFAELNMDIVPKSITPEDASPGPLDDLGINFLQESGEEISCNYVFSRHDQTSSGATGNEGDQQQSRRSQYPTSKAPGTSLI